MGSLQERRRHPRIQCRDVPLGAAFRLADGTLGRLVVTPRNVSRGGIAFVHASSVELGTRCDLLLPTTGSELLPVRGAVRVCRHMSLMLHEIAVQFDDELDEEAFADLAITGP